MITYNDYWILCHSFKGTTWKKHKYLAKIGDRYIYRFKNGDSTNGVYVDKKTGKAMQYRKGEDGTSYFSGGKPVKSSKKKKAKTGLSLKYRIGKKIRNAIMKVKGVNLNDYKYKMKDSDSAYDTSELRTRTRKKYLSFGEPKKVKSA